MRKQETIDAEVAAVAREHHGLFNVAQLDELDVLKNARELRIATNRWEPLYDHVYRIAGAPTTWKAEILAAC